MEEASGMSVKAILSHKGSDVATVDPNTDLMSAAKQMSERHIGALVVLGVDNRVGGIISERDIIHALAERGAAALSDPVSKVMTRKVTTCTESETIPAIMERMTAGKFRHVPVIEQDRLVGIISIGDVVKHRIEEIEHETAALKDYILTA
jgi:CBS domain-containing protein